MQILTRPFLGGHVALVRGTDRKGVQTSGRSHVVGDTVGEIVGLVLGDLVGDRVGLCVGLPVGL